MISAQLAHWFTPEMRDSGDACRRQGAVTLREVSARRVRATVSGGRDYQVLLRLEPARVTLSCTCQHFLDWREPCRHLWATILEVEERRPLTALAATATEAAPAVWLDLPGAASPARPAGGGRPPHVARTRPGGSEDGWRLAVKRAAGGAHRLRTPAQPAWPPDREPVYVLDVPDTLHTGRAVLRLYTRAAGHSGPGKLRPHAPAVGNLSLLADDSQRRILALLRAAVVDQGAHRYRQSEDRIPEYLFLREDLLRMLLPEVCAAGAFALKLTEGEGFEPVPLGWDEGPAWQFCLQIRRAGPADVLELTGVLRRGERSVDLCEPYLLLDCGLVLGREGVGLLEDSGGFSWIGLLRQRGSIQVPPGELSDLLGQLAALPALPPLLVAEELGIRVERLRPAPFLKVREGRSSRLEAELCFDYGRGPLPAMQGAAGLYLKEQRLLRLYDRGGEQAARDRLAGLGLRPFGPGRLRRELYSLAAQRLADTVEELLDSGWRVEIDGRLRRGAGRFSLEVRSSTDWLELRGWVSFGEHQVGLAQLLRALRRGGRELPLPDGSYGSLPERWRRRWQLLAGLAETRQEALRFRPAQASLLDALLAEQEQAQVDEGFRLLRERLSGFQRVEALDPPPTFAGKLREYQREGLGWFGFLDEFALGGCLADDMGLGKTVQVLALLESLRLAAASPGRSAGRVAAAGRAAAGGQSPPSGPSLVVVPRTLVFNWKREAARFAPRLRVLDYTGRNRSRSPQALRSWDVVLTTYGTVRNDIAALRNVDFHYVILDEAQAVKNHRTTAARAVRLLRGQRRLALSGTPVENHLGELWSLFEFLNPGMLGGLRVFQRHLAGGRGLDAHSRAVLARALRPFILRRTKEQVAPELPEKVEQVLYCEQEPWERRAYRELRDACRLSLAERINEAGFPAAGMDILKALLRLRQAACHPGLIDPADRRRPGAKLEMLLEHLEEVLAQGRKALVFSQFTTLLAIVRDALEARQIPYEYLDGRVRNRSARVERFQNDPRCPLFLISLKAGGVGVNLTAAEYVFLLDPWWNPAVEAQAIDRAHRIGQSRTVFAYRLIARGTVEERVLELQQAKRELAESIITADNRLIGTLTRGDLELLLS